MEALALEEKKSILRKRILHRIQTNNVSKMAQPVSLFEERLALLNKRRLKLDEKGYQFFEQTIDRYDGAWVWINDQKMLMMCSYSYLGLIGHPAIDQAAVSAIESYGSGTHGVRVLAGTLPVHKALESQIASFKGAEDAIVYSSGYVANLSTISTLTGPGDVAICDAYNHASIIDGCRLSGAEFVYFDHNEMVSLEEKLRSAGSRGKLVIADGVFSMDGDIADLPAMVALCRKYKAALMIDEAHSTGMLGATGRGIEEHFGLSADAIDIKMGTLSKTIPAVGGYVAGSNALIGALKANANGYFFSAAVPPAVAASARAAFEVIHNEPQRVKTLQRNMRNYLAGIRKLGFNTLHAETAVVPIICGDETTTFEMTRICHEHQVFVLPVLYPAVPVSLPRLRTTVTAAHGDKDIEYCLQVFELAGKETGLI